MAYSRFSNPLGINLTPWVKRLLIANAAVSVVAWLFHLQGWLAFVPAEILARPWTVLTYMFVHGDFWHLFFNMLGLLFFGPVLEERWGSREFVKFYFLCGLAGGLLSLFFPRQPIIGASAAIYGVLVAFAVYWPDNPIYIWGILPVKAKWLVLFLVGMSIFSTFTGRDASVAHLAHLGGAAAAFLYLKSPLAPSEWGEPYGAPRKKEKRWGFLRRRRLTAVQADAPAEPPRPTRVPVRQPADIDEILDKISQAGIQSLTPDERRRLEEASRRSRAN